MRDLFSDVCTTIHIGYAWECHSVMPRPMYYYRIRNVVISSAYSLCR